MKIRSKLEANDEETKVRYYLCVLNPRRLCAIPSLQRLRLFLPYSTTCFDLTTGRHQVHKMLD
jgi:hypothetical protein